VNNQIVYEFCKNSQLGMSTLQTYTYINLLNIQRSFRKIEIISHLNLSWKYSDRRLWQLKYDIQIVPIIFTAVVIICYIIWHQQTFSYDIMQRAITLSFFDGCIRTDGLLRSCPFARTRSFSISADAPLTRENVVKSKTEKTISRCPFGVEMKREETSESEIGKDGKGKKG